MELPYHLKTLLPEALDALRFFAICDGGVATVDDICTALDLSDRGFGKMIRRLVTKGYVAMDSSQVYRLTMSGREAAEELAAYDATAPADGDMFDSGDDDMLERRLVLAAPRALAAGQPAQVYLGFNRDLAFLTPVDLITRLSVVNGEPERPQEAQFHLGDGPDHRAFVVTPGAAPQMRLRVEVFQVGPDMDDFAVCGGMYVDVAVQADGLADSTLAAYGADLSIKRQD